MRKRGIRLNAAKKTLILLAIALLGISIPGCSQKNSDTQDTVAAIVTNLLTAPNELVIEAYDNIPLNAQEAEPQLLQVVSDLTDNLATDQLLKEFISGAQIFQVQLDAIAMGFSTKPQSVTVTSTTQDGQYSYESPSTIYIDGTQVGEVTFSGTAQLDESGSLTALTVNVAAMNALYATLS